MFTHRRSTPWLVLAALAALSACSKNSPSGSAKTEECDRSIPATGGPQKAPHPKAPSACLGVVMMCNYCAYDAQGQFTHSGSDACGACVGADF